MSETTATTGPAEELRTAAALMRQRAEATARPHHPYGDERAPLVETTEAWSAEVLNYLGGAMGEHCASMHPAVAFAVADWLEDEAIRIDDVPYRVDSDWIERNYRAPLAVARAYPQPRAEAVSR